MLVSKQKACAVNHHSKTLTYSAFCHLSAFSPLHAPIPEAPSSSQSASCTAASHSLANLETRRLVRCRSSSAASNLQESGGNNQWIKWIVICGLSIALVTLIGKYALSTDSGILLKDYLVNGPLGRSGFLAAFSLIFLSEIGDKTFFIAALLAMKLGKWISFAGSVTSLSIMTLISVGIGAICSRVPDAMRSTIPVGEIAGVCLLVFFGIRTLMDGLRSEEGPGAAVEEMADAESTVKEAESSGRIKVSSPLASFFEVATLIFIAEWGDRSMLATIALGAAQNPIGVATGAIAGHTIATGIAVAGGALASKHISERMISILSGVLFLVFAVATVVSML